MGFSKDNNAFPRTIPEALSRLEDSEKTALICGSEQLSYREMLMDVRHIALVLAERGIKKGDRVVQDMHRSADYIRVFLGIIYAGAVQVTLHSGWPAQQRAKALSDCAPVLVVDDRLARELLATSLKKDPSPDREAGESWADAKDSSDHKSVTDVKDSSDHRFVTDAMVSSDQKDGIDPETASWHLPEISGGDPCEIIYTSGSTGVPKGAVHSHQMVVSILTDGKGSKEEEQIFRYFTENSERILMDANPAFVLASGLFFRAFLYEKTLVMATEEETLTPAALADCIQRTGTDTLHGTSSRVLQSVTDPDYVRAIRSLKQIVLTGESADARVLNALEGAKAQVRYAYGSTETSICMFSPPCRKEEDNFYEAPFRTAPVYLLKKDSIDEVSPGTVGEICLGGVVGQSGYYWNDPELTAAKYITHPAFGRLFRTGDCALRETNGRIRILGRLDRMTKIHGQRIEPGAIETAMEAFPGIHRAAVKIQAVTQDHCNPDDKRGAGVTDDMETREVLCGYYSVEDFSASGPHSLRHGVYRADHKHSTVDQGALRRHLADSLPYYMVPAFLMELPELPLNVNGKLDYMTLPPIRIESADYAAPMSEPERLLCEVFAQVLGLDRPVGLDDSFFALGGDSIRAMAAGVLLKERGYEMKMEWIFAAPTVRSLAPMLLPVETGKETQEQLWSAQLSDAEWEDVERIVPRENVEAVYPLLHGVSGFFASDNPGWMCKACLMEESFTEEELRRRLRESVRCHQTMRSVFVKGDTGRAFQVVLKEWEIPVFFVDLRCLACDPSTACAVPGLPGKHAGKTDRSDEMRWNGGTVPSFQLSDAQKRYLGSLYRLLTAKPIAYTEVMFQAGLVRVSEERSVLVLACSHLLQDGSGYALIADELAGGAKAVSDVRQYNRYIRRLQSREYAEACCRAWQEILPAGGPAITALRPEAGSGQGTKAQRFVAGSAFAERARRFLAERSLTFAALVCYALGRTIMTVGGVETAGFFSSGSGRDAENVRLTGMFTGGIPVIVTKTDTLHSVQEQLVRASHCPPPDLAMLGEAFEKPAQGCFVGISMQSFLERDKKEDLFQGILAAMPAQERPSSGGRGLVDPRSIMIMVRPEDAFQLLVVSDMTYDPDGRLAGRLGRALLTELRRTIETETP